MITTTKKYKIRIIGKSNVFFVNELQDDIFESETASNLKNTSLYSVKVSISSTFYVHVFRMKFWCQKLQSFVLALRLFGAKKLCTKNACVKHWWNWPLVSILSTFYARLLCQYFCAKKMQSLDIIREKLRKSLLYKKMARKMLMKLTEGSSKPHTGSLFYYIGLE